MISRYRTIRQKGCGRQDEAVAAGTITPGHLIKRDSADKVVVHATDGGAAARMFAMEDQLQGRTTIQNYSADDVVTFLHALPGDEVTGILEASVGAAESTVIIGSPLTSAGNGMLKLATGSDVIIAEAREALDLSDTGDVDTQIKIVVR